MWQIRPWAPESNDIDSNLRCVPSSELFTLYELQEMENKDPRSTWRKKNTYCKHYGAIKDIKHNDAHQVSGKVVDTVSTWSVWTQFVAIPASSSWGGGKFLWRSRLSLKPATSLAHTPGRSGTGQRRAPDTHLPEKGVGEGRKGRKEPSLNPHQAPVID